MVKERFDRSKPHVNIGTIGAHMSWGERSCLKPCRRPNECSMETCNVDCPGYHRNPNIEPDSMPKNHEITRLRNSRIGKFSSGMGIDIADHFLPKADNELKGVDLEKEYALIKEKKSNLSASMRNMVVYRYEKLSHKEQ